MKIMKSHEEDKRKRSGYKRSSQSANKRTPKQGATKACLPWRLAKRPLRRVNSKPSPMRGFFYFIESRR